MTMFDIMPYATLIPVAIVALGYAIKGAVSLVEILAYGRDAKTQGQYVAFMDNCTARGLSYAEAMQEWRVRAEFARLRRDVSDAVALDVKNWKPILDTHVQKAFDRLALDGTDLLPLFGMMLRGTSYGDILYPAEAKMVDRLYDGVGASLSVDRRAALNVI